MSLAGVNPRKAAVDEVAQTFTGLLSKETVGESKIPDSW
jgi:hypothetical protein